MEKIRILADSSDPKDRTAHLRPLIEFIKAQGNEPKERDEFISTNGGYSEYRFRKPIDQKTVLDHFEFPESIEIKDFGLIWDDFHGLMITPGSEG